LNAVKRALIVVTTAVTIVFVTGLALSTSPAASGTLRAMGASVRAMTAGRPAAFAPTDAAATEFLPPIVITAGQNVTLQDKLTLTGTVTISCGPFISLSFSSASIQVTEPSGSTVAHASGQLPALICDQAPHTYGFTATASDAPFHPSSGQVSVFADACGTAPDSTFQCESAQNTSAVSIKR
jgi:hypothetical protein